MEVFDRQELKKESRECIRNNVFNLLIGNLIVIVAVGPMNFIVGFGQVISIALMVLYIGLCKFYINFIDNSKIDYSDIFFSFKQKDINIYFVHLGTIVIKSILIFLWALLLVVPGVIKALAYSQVEYIRAEKPEKEIIACLRESEELMYGHKLEYLIFQLSFIGWFVLSILTFGVLLIYVIPYYHTAMAKYFRRLRPIGEVELSPEGEEKARQMEPKIS